MKQKHKKIIVFTLIFSFLLLGTGVFVNNNREAEASDGEMLTMLRGMNQVLGLIAEKLSPFNVDNGNVGIGGNASDTENFAVRLDEGSGVRIGDWGNNGSTAFFVTPITKDQQAAIIRGIEDQESTIFSVQRSEKDSEVHDILTIRPDGRMCLEDVCITKEDLEKLKSL